MSIPKKESKTTFSIRPINLQYDALGYADASVLFEMGQTKILTSVTLQENVPPFLRGQKKGWLTAEYCMLPCATYKRTKRESTQHNRNSRSVEISRLVGRCLRSVVNLSLLGEKTIMIDCDVLQADGGTRVASITAASLALDLAIKRWLKSEIIPENILKETIAGISVGIVNGNFLLDLSYIQDSQADADFNFILTQSGKLIEVQGTAEKKPLSWKDFEILKTIAIDGAKQIFKICDKFSKNLDLNIPKEKRGNKKTHKTPFFGLGKRLEKTT